MGKITLNTYLGNILLLESLGCPNLCILQELHVVELAIFTGEELTIITVLSRVNLYAIPPLNVGTPEFSGAIDPQKY